MQERMNITLETLGVEGRDISGMDSQGGRLSLEENSFSSDRDKR